MSVALSADSNTAIMGGPGPNNADRGRSPFVGPAGAAWAFTRSGSAWTHTHCVDLGTQSPMRSAFEGEGGNSVITEFMLLLGIGFVAQLVDGALGMAYGVLSNAAMLTMGLQPAPASALVHTAEIFTTGASAASHIYHRNVDWRIVARLGMPGVLGAVLGAWILSNVDIANARRWVYGYLLLMGLYILWKSMRIALAPRTLAGWTAPLGFLSGFLDASGGGWGPLTTSTLIGSGHAPRQTVGSVNTTEFFVTVAAATTFFAELGASPLEHLIPLVLGGVLAAPFGGWAVKHVPARALMIAVGILVVMLSLFQLFRASA
jgi:uncharacterized protein